ncbi:hypothetical protein GQ54DRAFT_157553 [Martensiomyces pterosporus]|nr:hypothetical protein GQ54DRAFT_157553 [Martensiomyces pterosporus]
MRPRRLELVLCWRLPQTEVWACAGVYSPPPPCSAFASCALGVSLLFLAAHFILSMKMPVAPSLSDILRSDAADDFAESFGAVQNVSADDEQSGGDDGSESTPEGSCVECKDQQVSRGPPINSE